MTFEVPETRRLTRANSSIPHALASTREDGNNGAFSLVEGSTVFFCIASDGEGWEHVSVSARERGKSRTPTWDEMCLIKRVFWGPNDTVIQYHPAETNYVNCHPHTLHLWRPVGVELPLPRPELVGPK